MPISTRSSESNRARKRSNARVQPAIAADSEYLSAAHSARLLAEGAERRVERLAASDMRATDQIADEQKVTRTTVVNWINAGRCIALTGVRRGYKLPNWQFAPAVWNLLPAITDALGTSDGWSLLTFFESPHPALRGLTPIVALQRGMGDRVMAIAEAGEL